ncbi:MAG: hypothetical protein U0V74_14530 [Chitinophagales bacterium]
MKKRTESKFILPLSMMCLVMTIFLSACHHDDPDTISPEAISCNDINSDVVWADRGDGIDYTVNCEITTYAKITIEPGVVIRFENNAGIRIASGGSLKAIGTATNPIVLKGNVDAAGVWKGLYFQSNSVENELNYCTISNGGSASFDGNNTRKANIRVANNAQLKIRNSTVSKSAYDGLYVDGLDVDAINPVTVFNNNTFSDNQNYPVSTIGAMVTVMDGTTSQFTGNTKNKILVRGGRLYGNHTWNKANVNYLIQDVVSAGYYTDNGNLTINPGVTIEFAGDAGLCTGDYSTASWLKINGSSTEHVVLKGETTAAGAWKGVAFQSTSPNNDINYADISDGGSSSYTGATQKRANIHAGAWSDGSFTISNTTISNSAAWGIWVTLGSPDITIPASVTYSSNASGNYYKE